MNKQVAAVFAVLIISFAALVYTSKDNKSYQWLVKCDYVNGKVDTVKILSDNRPKLWVRDGVGVLLQNSNVVRSYVINATVLNQEKNTEK